MNHNGSDWIKSPRWDLLFPKYDVKDIREAIGIYWDDYYKKI